MSCNFAMADSGGECVVAILSNVEEHPDPWFGEPSRGAGSCPLVLGECVQGQIRGGPHFLITAPIKLDSRAEFIADLSRDHITVEPAHCVKSLEAVCQYIAGENLPLSGLLRVYTGTPTSLGFGTSTADIAASVRAAAAAWNRSASPEAISRIAISIEPTDGSMFAGSVAYAHREGRLLEALGSLPRFRAIVILCGVGVDTVAFDNYRVHFRYSAEAEQKLQRAWWMVRESIRTADVSILGQAGIISAEINQELLFKPLFDEIRNAVEPLGASGLLVAHSGSLLGVILDPGKQDYLDRRERVLRFLEELNVSVWCEVANY
jgi:L-threonine kinase